MFNLIHEMRKRVFTSKAFTNAHIIGAILFEKTMLLKLKNCVFQKNNVFLQQNSIKNAIYYFVYGDR